MNAPHRPEAGPAPDAALAQLEKRAAERLRASADGLDAQTRSRLTQARHAALAQAGQGNPVARWFGLRFKPGPGAGRGVLSGTVRRIHDQCSPSCRRSACRARK